MFRTAATLLVALLLAAPAAAQSQAVNGTIEGTVSDSSGAVLPGVTIVLTSVETGATRLVVTNERGLYQAPLLPLGTYRLQAELQGFKAYERSGITLSAGQTAVIDLAMAIGALTETVSVTADAPVVDPGKIDLGRNLNEREVRALPLVSRNPYNFALLQPGVSGVENAEFGVPRFSANGALLRINYQIDGNTNTQKDRAGLRLLPMSEVMVREVKVVTSGYAPEFGQTTGLVYNAITPSGTNDLRGSAGYRVRRRGFSARPFYFQPSPAVPDKPDTHVDTVTADLGGPVVRDRAHFFVGFERTARDLSADRAITISPAAASALGLTADQASGVMPAEQTARFLLGKIDVSAGSAHRVTARYILFRNSSPNNIGGGLSSTEWATDFTDAMGSAAAQVVSTFGNDRLNELRVQFARRNQSRAANALSGHGPAVTVSGVANFGGPYDSTSSAGFDFTQRIWQVVENFTWIRGAHSVKVGGDLQVVADARQAAALARYTFPNLAAYLAARDGTDRRSYTNYAEFIGVPTFRMTTALISLFVQDDWRIASKVKLLYGLRYDRYRLPDGDPEAPYEASRAFTTDGNNVGPRVGLSWALGSDGRTVLRASTGVMYDQPLLAAYENAVQQNGVRAVSASLGPTSPAAPAFPDTLAPSATVVLPALSIAAVDRGFRTARSIQSNVQIDRAVGDSHSVRVGFVYARGTGLPVVTNVNPINPVGALADGRPVYAAAVGADTRRDPRFNQINMVQSIGESTYRALTLQFTRRFSKGLQFDLTYAYGKGEDNAPLTTVLAVQGDDGRTDPSNLDRDKGPNVLDTRHTFAGSLVATPSVAAASRLARAILNDNQIGVMMQFNSGLPFSIRSNQDLNRDGVLSDRPLGVGRNSLYLPPRYNVDLRYSRFVPIRGRWRGEVVAEFKNVVNNRQTAGVNRVVATDAAGSPLAPIPSRADDFPMSGRSGYEARQFQVGFKITY